MGAPPRFGGAIHARTLAVIRPGAGPAESVTMVVQVNGKVRDRIEVSPDITEEEALRIALASERVVAALGGVEPSRVVARPPRLVNFVV